MGFKIITGGQGSGKTNKAFKDLINHSKEHPGERHLVITPDQSSLITERRLLEMTSSGVLFNIEVLGFNRLAYHIFRELELPLPKTIDEVGKGMLVRKAVAENRSRLSLYKSSADKEGFIHKVKVLISELLMYDVSAQSLHKAAESADSPYLASKLLDMSICLDAFNKARDKARITSEELLVLLLSVIGESHYLDGAYVVLDGFTGFSPVHYKIIDYIFSRAADVTVSLTIPEGENPFAVTGAHELFALTKQTFRKLQKLGEERGHKLMSEVSTDYADIKRPQELLELEKKFLRPGKPAPFAIQNPDAVRIISCRSTGEQADYIAQTVFELVRDQGYRYKDFAVVSGNLEKTDYLFAKAFRRYDIPCFIDQRRSELLHPLVVLILSLLEAAEKNLPYAPVMRMLRTGLLLEDEAALDELDNYIIALGIRGRSKWSLPFTKTSSGHKSIDFVRLNQCREAAIIPLLEFDEEFSRAKAPEDIVNGIKKFLETYGIKDKLTEISKQLRADGEESIAQDYERIYESVIKVIEESSEIINVEKISIGKYRKILTSGFAELTSAVLPPALDQVSIGDIKRSRRGYIKVLFFADMNEGVIPKASGSGGILNDTDRQKLFDAGIELAPTSTDSMFMDQFYIYEMLATPTDRLYLTFPYLDTECSSLVKSIYIDQIISIFDGLKITAANINLTGIDDAFRYFAKICREARSIEDLSEIRLYYNCLREINPRRTDMIFSTANLPFEQEHISSGAFDKLFNNRFRVSASALEAYAECPYKGFVSYMLRLKPRAEYAFDNLKRGSFFHKIFETAFKKIISDGIVIDMITDADRKKLLEEGFNAAVADVTDYNLSEQNVDIYLTGRWKRAADKALWAMLEQLKDNRFVPHDFECNFSTENSGSSIILANGRQMDITGRIDRIDTITCNGRTYAAVIDYKSSAKDMNMDTVSEGTTLQLPLYLHFAADMLSSSLNEDVKPGLMGYFSFADATVEGKVVNDINKTELLNRYKIKGAGIPEFYRSKIPAQNSIDDYINTALDTILRLGEDFSGGIIDIAPKETGSGKSVCEFCIMRDCCAREKNEGGV